MKITQVEWGPVAKAAWAEYGEKRDDVPGLAAEMAYWIVFSIFPFFAFLAVLVAIVGKVVGTNELQQSISDSILNPLPPSTAESIRGPLNNLLNAGGGALSIGALLSAILALNSASTAVTTTMKAFNRAYGVEETRSFFVKKGLALGLTLVLVLLIVGGATFLSLGGKLADALGLGGAGELFFQLARFVGPIIGISLGLAILYWKGPNLKQQFQWISPGSVIATIVLLVLAFAFGQYVVWFGESSYSKTYGTAAGIILFLFFLRLASTVILLGAEFNAEAAKRYDPETIRDKVTNPRKMLPGQQPMPHPQAIREAGMTPQQVAQSDAASTGKVASGAVGAGAGATAMQAGQGTGPAPRPGQYIPGVLDNPEVKEKLRAVRERPYTSAEEEARRAISLLPEPERARRARTTLTAVAISIATALGGVLFGTRRRSA